MAAPMRNMIFVDNKLCRLFKRNYSTNFRRRAVKILAPNEEREKLIKSKISMPDIKPGIQFLPNSHVQNSSMKLKNTINSTANQASSSGHSSKDKHQTYSSKDGSIEYTSLQDDDLTKKFSKILMNTNSKTQKGKRRDILLEGKTQIIDALKAKGQMKYLYISKLDALENFPVSLVRCPAYKVPHRHLKEWTITDSSHGILAVFEMPKEGEITIERQEELPVTLICDRLKNPENMGSIIRTAAAIGCKKVITMPGCVDVWHSKVLHAAGCAHFRQPIISRLSWEHIVNYIPPDSQVFMADTRRPSKWSISTIAKSNIKSTEDSNVHENNEIDYEQENEHDEDSDIDWSDNEGNFTKIPLDVSLYTEAEFTPERHTCLIVGGEDKGFSPQANKLMELYGGRCLMLPMATGINRLNPEIITSVLLYEIHKIYSMKRE